MVRHQHDRRAVAGRRPGRRAEPAAARERPGPDRRRARRAGRARDRSSAPAPGGPAGVHPRRSPRTADPRSPPPRRGPAGRPPSPSPRACTGSTRSRARRGDRSRRRHAPARSARSCRVTAPLTSATRGRSVRTSTAPSRAPRTSTVPAVGHSRAAATWSNVVLPEPFGPEDDPAVGRVDTPVDPGQHRHALAADGDAAAARWPVRGADPPSHPGAVAVGDAPGDAPDEARAALRPRALAGQPQPDLAPVAQHDPPEVLLARGRPRPGSASASTARARRRRPRSARARGPRRRGRRPASPRPARWARRARAARARRPRSMADEDGLAVASRRRCARAPRSR